MNIEDLRTYCLSKAHTTEGFPFDANTLVFKVANKMFAVTGLERLPPQINLKCDPEYALELREQYSEIVPGWHMNKNHWNTVEYSAGLSDKFLKELIDHSYNLVVESLTKKVKMEFGFM